MNTKYILAIILTLGGSLCTQAQNTQSKAEHQLDEVIVTGTQTQRSLKNLPMIAQVITQKEIERVHPRSVADILQMTIPGVEVSVHGAQYRVSIQGMSGDYILFLMDGERITSEGNGVVDLNRIDISTIERIEVIRGAASALYGSNAIGGVVNFITRQAKQPLQATLSGDWSGDGVSRYNASLSLRRAGFSSISTANYTLQRPYDLPNGATTTTVYGSNTINLGEQLRYQSLSKAVDAKAYLRYSFRRQDNDPKRENHYTSMNTGGRLYWSPSEAHSLSIQYGLERYDRETYYLLVTDPKERYQPVFDYTGHTLRGQYNYGQEGEDRVLVNAGTEVLIESLRGDRFESESDLKRASLISLYAQADWRLTEALSLEGGLRQDIHSRFGGHLTPRLSALYRLGQWRLRASYSEGFRSPSFKELFMDWDHLGMFRIKGNEHIRPEQSKMISLSPEWQCGNLNLSIIGSYNIVKNRIGMREEDNGAVYRYYNTDEVTKLWNIQTNLRYRLPWGLGLQMDYTYLNDTERVQTQDGSRAAGSTLRPHHLNALVSYDKHWHNFSLSASYSCRLSSGVDVAVFDSATNAYTKRHYDAYSISRLGLSAMWRRHIRLTLGVDNLFDYRVKAVNISSSLSPGINLFAGLSISY